MGQAPLACPMLFEDFQGFSERKRTGKKRGSA